jgi:hypothetical protein
MWSYVSDEERIPQDHPLRAISAMTDVVLKELSPRFTPLRYHVGWRMNNTNDVSLS